MTWQILSVAAWAALTILGLFIVATSSEAGSIRFGYVMAIVGGICFLLFLVQILRSRKNRRTPRSTDKRPRP